MTETRPLRIVHLVRSPVGGIFRHIGDLVSAQAEAGHSVGFVCDSLTGGPFEEARIAALAPSLALGSVRLPIARQVSASDVRALADVRKALAPLSPDVIHSHGAKGGVFGRLVGTWLGRERPVARIYAPHGGSLHYDPASLEGRAYFQVERALERVTDAIIHVSAYEARTYVEKVGEPRCATAVVRNGLRSDEFAPVAPARDATDFLYMGVLRDLKGVDVFIDALTILARSGRPLSATIIGDGDDAERYRATILDRGLRDHVRFRPPTPTREGFALGRAIVVPSRAESMPYIVLEAIAAELPILATRVGGIPEIFGPHSHELLPAADPAALAAAMTDLVRNPERAAAATGERRRHISGEFSLSSMSSRVESVYRDAIGRRNRRD